MFCGVFNAFNSLNRLFLLIRNSQVVFTPFGAVCRLLFAETVYLFCLYRSPGLLSRGWFISIL